jgi:hypothetical protein
VSGADRGKFPCATGTAQIPSTDAVNEHTSQNIYCYRTWTQNGALQAAGERVVIGVAHNRFDYVLLSCPHFMAATLPMSIFFFDLTTISSCFREYSPTARVFHVDARLLGRSPALLPRLLPR